MPRLASLLLSGAPGSVQMLQSVHREEVPLCGFHSWENTQHVFLLQKMHELAPGYKVGSEFPFFFFFLAGVYPDKSLSHP